jgi:hypothetical protein
MERIFKAAKALGFEVFISPHYFYPTYKGWKSTDRWKPMKPPLGCSRVKES